jgi:chromosome segregation protein
MDARKRDVDARLRRDQEVLDGAVMAFAQLEPRLQGLREERSRRQSALLESRGRLILLRSEARSLWAETRGTSGEGDWRTRRLSLTSQREAYEEEIKQIEAVLPRDREELTAISSKRNVSIDAMSEAAAAHADLEGEARSLMRQIELVRANLGRTDGQLKSREEALKAIDADLQALTERSQAGSMESIQAREELAALTTESEPAEGELSHLAAREREMREQLAAARSRLLEAERSFLEAESAVKLREEELDGLREVMAGEGFRPEGRGVVSIGASEAPTREQAGGRLPPVRGGAGVDAPSLRQRVAELRQQIRGLGPVNEQAQTDYGESKERYDFLTGQVEDLTGSEQTLLTAIDELESNIRERLKATFAVVDKEFQRYFESFFNGGQARLVLTQPDDYANTGIDIQAQPPGKRVNTLAMLSGGERTLTALALLLALLEANPSPICVLDEVDAALDETNVGRFVEALQALEKKTQFIIITHNPRTIEAADSIYGVSMGADNTSRVLSVRLGEPGAE